MKCQIPVQNRFQLMTLISLAERTLSMPRLRFFGHNLVSCTHEGRRGRSSGDTELLSSEFSSAVGHFQRTDKPRFLCIAGRATRVVLSSNLNAPASECALAKDSWDTPTRLCRIENGGVRPPEQSPSVRRVAWRKC
jgi:hypothetical protein